MSGLSACDEPTGPERTITGERLFIQNCARCHGADGKVAADAPAGTRDLTEPGYMSMLTDQQIKRTIQMGKPPNMPSFGRQFAEPSLKVITAYVRQLSTPGAGAGAGADSGAGAAAAGASAASPTSPTEEPPGADAAGEGN